MTKSFKQFLKDQIKLGQELEKIAAKYNLQKTESLNKVALLNFKGSYFSQGKDAAYKAMSIDIDMMFKRLDIPVEYFHHQHHIMEWVFYNEWLFFTADPDSTRIYLEWGHIPDK